MLIVMHITPHQPLSYLVSPCETPVCPSVLSCYVTCYVTLIIFPADSPEYAKLKEERSQVLWRAVERIIPDIRSRAEVSPKQCVSWPPLLLGGSAKLCVAAD
jgi:hypothetical protein